MSRIAFISRYLKKEDGSYHPKKELPCIFFKNNECLLKEAKPVSCAEFPHTQKQERLFSLYSLVDAATICPVAFQIVEDLKEIYHFKY